MISADGIINDLTHIRESAPLIHNITNFVAMQPTANALLAIGASPVMAHAVGELDDILRHAKALVINIGTLDDFWLDSMRVATKLAKQNNIPVVLDPVGVGASILRTESALSILNANTPAVIRGNAAEIMALAGETVTAKGVDSQYQSVAAFSAAARLSQAYNCVVVVSGAQDWIVDRENSLELNNGVPMMTRVTGMGCTATALIGAFCAVNPHYFSAAAHAMSVMGIAGEVAMARSEGPGSLQMHFTDALYGLNQDTIAAKLRVKACS